MEEKIPRVVVWAKSMERGDWLFEYIARSKGWENPIHASIYKSRVPTSIVCFLSFFFYQMKIHIIFVLDFLYTLSFFFVSPSPHPWIGSTPRISCLWIGHNIYRYSRAPKRFFFIPLSSPQSTRFPPHP